MSMRQLRPSERAATAPLHPVLKQKACIPCRTRKVKCDKKTPCTNCVSWALECVFPSPIRRCPRPKRKHTPSRSPAAPMRDDVEAGSEDRVCVKDSGQSVDERIQKLERTLNELTQSLELVQNSRTGTCEPNDNATDYGRDLGKLGTIEARIGELKSKRDEILKFFEVEPSLPHLTGAFSNNGSNFFPQSINANRLFPFNSFAVEVAPLHPSAVQSQTCWRIFLENVDQLVKVLHRPSAEEIIRNAADGSTPLSKGQEALLFTIYFSSIISMGEDDVQACFRMSKPTASMTYRSAAEQALTRAEFLTSQDLITLQAFVLFLSFNLYVDDPKLVWALTGLARRLCNSASNLSGTTPPSLFEQEMHRRLWWQLWFLDRRAAEDQGEDNGGDSQPERKADPELPLSIDDKDLSPNLVALPRPTDDWTEMSFSLIRYEIARTSRRIVGNNSHIPHHEKEKMVNDCVSKIQSMHLQYCDGSDPIHWLAQHASYVTVTEMWMQLYEQAQDLVFVPSPGSAPIPQATQVSRDQLFFAAIDIVDIPKRLETEPGAHRWKWLLKAYLQFHPLKFLLSELYRRLNEPPESHQADYDEVNTVARRVATFAFTRWTEENRKSKNGEILTRLMQEAEETWRIGKRRRAITHIDPAAPLEWHLPSQMPPLTQGSQVVGPPHFQNTHLEKANLDPGVVNAAFSGPGLDYEPTELSYSSNNTTITPPNSIGYNNTDFTPDFGSGGSLSWGIDSRSQPPVFDAMVAGYFPEGSDMLEEGVYSF
ncbi:hypothetical protein FQN54_002399 [Arachnomyces sp. PD_36]|nr:hypothetical protein FQN54_002399 [Arachnomyces sp. PD_36]